MNMSVSAEPFFLSVKTSVGYQWKYPAGKYTKIQEKI